MLFLLLLLLLLWYQLRSWLWYWLQYRLGGIHLVRLHARQPEAASQPPHLGCLGVGTVESHHLRGGEKGDGGNEKEGQQG